MILFALLSLAATLQADPSTLVGQGSSPQLALDPRGTVRMVFGRKDTIFAVTSRDGGQTFTPAAMVGVVRGMHLGNTRGPTIASSRARSTVLAVDTAGNLTAFQLDHRSNRWTRIGGYVNDAKGSAPEGLATIAATDAGIFVATWLDLREGRKNNIYLGTVASADARRLPNRKIYASPDGHTCECCRPTITTAGKHVAVMFRNWLDGARDMYVARSSDGGKRFASVEKLGQGTWKLDACPMDGGAASVDAKGDLATVWRRESTVYYARPGEKEVRIGEGRSPMMSRFGATTYLVWEDRGKIKLTSPGNAIVNDVAEGRHPQVLALPGGRVLVAWDKDGAVRVQSFAMGEHHHH